MFARLYYTIHFSKNNNFDYQYWTLLTIIKKLYNNIMIIVAIKKIGNNKPIKHFLCNLLFYIMISTQIFFLSKIITLPFLILRVNFIKKIKKYLLMIILVIIFNLATDRSNILIITITRGLKAKQNGCLLLNLKKHPY